MGRDRTPEGERTLGQAEPAGRRSPLRHVIVAAAVLATVGLVALLAYGLVAGNPDSTIDDALARRQPPPAPAFRLAVLQRGALGRRLTRPLAQPLSDGWLSNSELRGTPYVLNIWASWCVPCREEAPRLQRAWLRARSSGVLFVGLDMQDVTSDAHAFLANFSVSYLNIRDPTNDVARRYGATGVPETFFITARGRIVNHVLGTVTPKQLRDGIRDAVAGRTQAARQGGARRPAR